MTSEKRCTKCGETKPLEEFPRRFKNRDDKRATQCKVCTRQWRKDNKKVVSEATRRWRKNNAERFQSQMATYRERHPEKIKAHNALRKAVYKGRIVKPEHCEDCGEQFEKRQIQGHHEDYSRPLDVEWLCVGCHVQKHREEEAA